MKTLAQLKTICQYHGWQDATTTGLSQLTEFINETIQMLASMHPWPEYNKVDGSATITANTDSVTLAQSNIWKIGSLIRTDRAVPLDEIDQDEWLRLRTYHQGTGAPTHYALQREYVAFDDGSSSSSADDTAAHLQINVLVYPKPTANTILYYTYRVHPVILSSDSDTTDWPDTRMHLLTQALRIRVAAQDRDAGGVALYSEDFRRMVEKAYAQARPSFRPFVAMASTYQDHKTPLRRIEKTVVS